MQNQFFYTRKELVSGTPENPEFKEFRDSFNINKVVRMPQRFDLLLKKQRML